MKKLFSLIDFLNEKVATKIACWLVLPIIFLVSFEVVARYVFNKPTSWSSELTWMFYGALVYLGGAYTLKHDGHVKADVLYSLIPERARAIINIILYPIFFFPVFIALIYGTYITVIQAFVSNQKSPFTNWEPLIWPIKAVILVSLVLITLQAIVEFAKHIKALMKGGYEKHES